MLLLPLPGESLIEGLHLHLRNLETLDDCDPTLTMLFELPCQAYMLPACLAVYIIINLFVV